jgi:hypothetical protein
MFFTPSVRRNGAPIFEIPESRPQAQRQVLPPLSQQQQQPEQPIRGAKPMKWGEPTWFLFHTLAQKIRDDSFPTMRIEVLNICFLICRNLPCPSCADHATKYMQNINFSRIQTKQQLIDLFYEFHNAVNSRKGMPLFNRFDLEQKYAAANTIEIIRNFLEHYADKSRSVRNISHDFFRQRAVGQVQTWLKTNLQHFSP